MEGVKASVASNPGPCVCYTCILRHLSSQVGLGGWIDGLAVLPFQGMSSIPGTHVRQFIITCDSSSRGPDATCAYPLAGMHTHTLTHIIVIENSWILMRDLVG